jgi:hypothetical protein
VVSTNRLERLSSAAGLLLLMLPAARLDLHGALRAMEST